MNQKAEALPNILETVVNRTFRSGKVSRDGLYGSAFRATSILPPGNEEDQLATIFSKSACAAAAAAAGSVPP